MSNQPNHNLIVVLRCSVDGPKVADPAARLAELVALGRSTFELATDPDGIGALVAAALGARGTPPRGHPGRSSALEWTGQHWRLVSHNAIEPLHGLAGDEGIGRPVP